MAPFLVILSLLLLGVGIVAWHTRETFRHLLVRKPDPKPGYPAQPDAFAEAPLSRASFMMAPVAAPPVAAPTPVAANESDPFAHAPSVSELTAPKSVQQRP